MSQTDTNKKTKDLDTTAENTVNDNLNNSTDDTTNTAEVISVSAEDTYTDVTKDDTVDNASDVVVDEINSQDSQELSSSENGIEVKDNVDFRYNFKSGDTVIVHYKITEGNKSRIQPYQGIVIAFKGKENSKTFTVRRIGADNIGVERIFPLHSPNIENIEVLKRGKVRRAKLYYLRHKIGKAAMKVKELGK